MKNEQQSAIVKKFADYLGRNRLTDELELVYRVSGGAPGDFYEEECDLFGSGRTRVKLREAARRKKRLEAAGEIEKDEVRELLDEVTSSVGTLYTRETARFLPDSLVGSITLTVGGETETYYFLADDTQREIQEQVINQPTLRMIHHLKDVSQRLLRGSKEVPDA